MLNIEIHKPKSLEVTKATWGEGGRCVQSLEERLIFTSPSEKEAVEDASNEGCDI